MYLKYISYDLLLYYFADLIRHFNSFINPASDSTPCSTVFSLLIQTLQKVPRVESRSQDMMRLFLKFLGYSVNDLIR